MKLEDLLKFVNDVPDYQVFLTVDELKASSQQLAADYPGVVEVLPVGHSRQGETIEALRIGNGVKQALVFALPHPNEPIGSMMLEYLSRRLAEDDEFRHATGYTWYLIKCIDPDGTRLNEGWFKGPFSVTNYARHFYRPPAHQQIEWTFPIDYKTLHFHDPLPETQALMKLIEQLRPEFIYSLHNAGFGGTYLYLSEPAPSIYAPFYELVDKMGLPLHLGESEMPWAVQYTNAIFKVPLISEWYDFLVEQTGRDPAEIITGGTASFDYANAFGDPFTLVCEMPYFYNTRIHDTSLSGMSRREALLQDVEQARADLAFWQAQIEAIKDELTSRSPFLDTLEYYLQTFPASLAAQENWAKTDPATDMPASQAQKFDSLAVHSFYRLLGLGMLVRLIDAQCAVTGGTPALSAAREQTAAAFQARSAALEAELDYSVIPIRKLVQVQLGCGLLAADYAAQRH